MMISLSSVFKREERQPQLENATGSDQEVSSLCVQRDGDYLSFDLHGIQS